VLSKKKRKTRDTAGQGRTPASTTLGDARRLCREIVQTAQWLAGVDGDLPGGVVRRIQRAHEALRVVKDQDARNGIVAQLAHAATQPDLDRRVGEVRGWIDVTLRDPTNRLEGNTQRLRDDTILAAIWAWHSGKRGPAGMEKWEATKALFRECRMNVTELSLRRGWDRRLKSRDD
jgi:hypothetical protein